MAGRGLSGTVGCGGQRLPPREWVCIGSASPHQPARVGLRGLGQIDQSLRKPTTSKAASASKPCVSSHPRDLSGAGYRFLYLIKPRLRSASPGALPTSLRAALLPLARAAPTRVLVCVGRRHEIRTRRGRDGRLHGFRQPRVGSLEDHCLTSCFNGQVRDNSPKAAPPVSAF